MNPYELPPALNLAKKLLAAACAAIMLVLGFMFSLMFLALILAVGLCLWAYVWYKTRQLRRLLRVTPQNAMVIEGQTVVIDDSFATQQETIFLNNHRV